MTTLKTIWAIVLSTCCINLCYAQILVTPQIPPQGLMQKKQLWNMLMVNNSGLPQQVQVQMWLSDRATGQKLLNGKSRTILLQKGATQLREDDFAPVQYNFSGGYATPDRNVGDLLIAGSYYICYALISAEPKVEALLSEECVNADVEPLSPPQLITPADTSMIETNYPSFNWIPPAPAAMFTDLKYEILIVEIKKGQNAYDAIQRNAPIYIQRYLNTPFLLYPSSYKALEPEKIYAWQVIAKNGTTYSQKTETWSFRIKADSASIVIDANAYTKLSKGYDANSYICHGNIRFEYNNETGDSTTTVNIYNVQADTRTLADTKEIELRQGQNFINMPIGYSSKYKSMQVYILEISNSRKEKWNLKFRYVKKD